MNNNIPDNIDLNNKEFQDVLNLILYTNQSVFLTGRAGSGKSTFLRYICENSPKSSVVVAPTGIAAINAGGVTLHSFFKIPFRPILPNDPDLSLEKSRIFEFLKYSRPHQKLINNLELLIIDEISMLRADILDFVDRVLRVYRGKMTQPFGGVQLLMVGDVFQLEPVVKRDEWDILRQFYESPYFFSANVFKQFPLVPIELQKVYRQSDNKFVELLDKVRMNQLYNADYNIINQRVNNSFVVPKEDFYITLATRRDTVDYINDRKLAEQEGEEFTFLGTIQGEFTEATLPTNKELILKVNAQVMFVKNDTEHRWYNGSIGRVQSIDNDEIVVVLEDGSEHLVQKEVWKNIRYKYDEKNKKIIEEEIGSFTQYPLRLAWAITIHKSQGLTFDKVVVDLSGGAFAGGQLYVALSRCTSLEGMVLKTAVKPSDVIVKREVINFSRQANNPVIIEKAMAAGRADRLFKEAYEQFKKSNFQEAIAQFAQANTDRNDLALPKIQRFISLQMNKLLRYKKRVSQLEEEMAANRKKLQEFAREYYLMANECLVKAKDKQAALANLNKAIDLNPHFFDALFRKASILVEMADYHGAEQFYTMALEVKPKSFKTLYNRGRTRIMLKQHNGAYNDLLAASRIKDNHADTFQFLGNVCEKLGEMEEAQQYWNMAHNLSHKEDDED